MVIFLMLMRVNINIKNQLENKLIVEIIISYKKLILVIYIFIIKKSYYHVTKYKIKFMNYK